MRTRFLFACLFIIRSLLTIASDARAVADCSFKKPHEFTGRALSQIVIDVKRICPIPVTHCAPIFNQDRIQEQRVEFRDLQIVSKTVMMCVLIRAFKSVSGTDSKSRYCHFKAERFNILQVLSNAETTRVLVWVSLLASAMAIGLSLFQGLLTLTQSMEAWLAGLRGITDGLMVMVMAWGVGFMSRYMLVLLWLDRQGTWLWLDCPGPKVGLM